MTAVNRELEDTRAQLARLVEAFMELGVMVHDFEGTDQAKHGLLVRLDQTLQDLRQLASSSQQIKNTPIPLDVLQYIEDGRNPNVYTREFVESTALLNEQLATKVRGLERLQQVLGSKLAAEFPELEEAVESLK